MGMNKFRYKMVLPARDEELRSLHTASAKQRHSPAINVPDPIWGHGWAHVLYMLGDSSRRRALDAGGPLCN